MKKWSLDEAISMTESFSRDSEKDPQYRSDFSQLAGWLKELRDLRAGGARGTAEWLPTQSDPRKGRCSRCRGRSFRSFKYCPDCGRLMIKSRV